MDHKTNGFSGTVAAALILTSFVDAGFSLGSGGLGNQTGIATAASAHGNAFAGIADDASATFYNPAGLPQVKGLNVMVGATAVDVHSKHTAPDGTVDKGGRSSREVEARDRGG